MIPITFISEYDYWDRPLTGWLRVKGRYHYFHIDDAHADEGVWSIYKVPRDITLVHLKRVRRWRQLVGWASDYNPQDENWKLPIGYRDDYEEGVKKFNEEGRMPDINLEECTLIGKTNDLEFMVEIK